MDQGYLDQSFNYLISEHKYEEFVKLMEEKCVDVDYRLETFDCETLLHKSVEMLCFPIVEYLLEHSASVDEIDYDRLTPLHLLCSLPFEGKTVEDSLKILGLLLKKKCKVNKRAGKGSSGRTALYLSIENKNYHLVETLINAGSDLNARCGHSRRTVLHVATMTCPKRLILLLLRYGADPLIKDKKGNFCYQIIKKKREKLSEELQQYTEMFLDYSPNCICEFANTYEAIIAGHSDYLINAEDVSDLKSISEGTYGVVYKGKYQKKFDVAVKRFKNVSTPSSKQLIIREIAICCTCDHANIVKMHGYFYAPPSAIEKQETKSTLLSDIFVGSEQVESDSDNDEIDEEELDRNDEEFSSQSWIVTEWMPTDLHSFLYPPSQKNIHHQGFFNNNKISKLKAPIFIKIITGIAEGMKYLHYEKKIVHRDLKPANILLDSKNNAKIMDFGLSRFEVQSPNSDVSETELNSLRRTMTLNRGTDLYMAPEMKKQAFSTQESDYSFPVDVFSFGLIMWEIIMRLKPRELAFAITQKKDTSKIPMPNVEDCPAEVIELLKGCIQVNPSDRPKFEEICEILNNLEMKN
ncbi:serine/threonine-protein kinase tnni3k-related [Anaeramoeba flamelloides]|uniref:Serine/threonine-protein kinase tnni3k-related n=1 Tax=Anaeramoeba flamelloides TaxID=1746091 RepID=A0ABQ8XHT2_9EUKA|nr:serine/threonine-protein kinase tnni3k-related [Anaeramoeba flamelloides]